METPAAVPADSSARPLPLLPPVLLGSASFFWLWVLPLVVLGLLNWHGYWLIGSEMNAAQRSRATFLGVAWIANLLSGCLVFVFARFGGWTEKDIAHPLWGLPGLLCQIAYLWLAMSSLAEGLLPGNVTAWIYPEGRFVFNQFSFCMLPAFHGILRLAAARPGASPLALGKTFVVSIGAAIGAPVFLYLVLQTASTLASQRMMKFPPYLFATLVIVCGVVMFFGVLRSLLVALNRVQSWHVTGERWAVVLLALALPLAGLTLNAGIPFPVDFQALDVYALTVANAGVVLFAVWMGESRPWLSWHLLCATFPFSLYFFIVFLPFTPLSVLGVIAVGLGLLVLTPILLFAFHLYLLGKAWRQVGARGPRGRLLFGGALAVLLLPAFFTARGLADKAALNAALSHLYEPAFPEGDIAFGSSLTNLRRAVDSHRAQKEGLYYPLLSDYYAWLVFDNLVLPDAKLQEIENVFFGPRSGEDLLDPLRKPRGAPDRGRAADRKRVRAVPLPPQTVAAENLVVRTSPLDAGSTAVTISLELRNTGSAPAEFTTALTLPSGVFVCGFRLQVGDALVPGRIFEKKTALWVYSMIRDTERRDPGILYYRTASELELRVFPIIQGKPARVEVDVMVPSDVATGSLAKTGSIADVLGSIGRLLQPVAAQGPRGDLVVAGLDTLSLPAVDREPYIHLIVDRSHDRGFHGDLSVVWPKLRERFPEARRVRISAANYEVTTVNAELSAFPEPRALRAGDLDRIMPLSGGLALDLALAHAIRQHHDRDLGRVGASAVVPPRPIFIILSRHAAIRQLELSLAAAWSDALPGLLLYEAGADGSFVAHIEETGAPMPLLRTDAGIRPVLPNRLVRFERGATREKLHYWNPHTALWQRFREDEIRVPGANWTQAAGLQLEQQDHDRNPAGARFSRRSLVEASRSSGILLPSASYIVVENQAQWRVLETSERQKLGQNQALDFVETPAPPALWVALGFAGWLWLRRRKNSRDGAGNHGGIVPQHEPAV